MMGFQINQEVVPNLKVGLFEKLWVVASNLHD